jgi:hypothetical protein
VTKLEMLNKLSEMRAEMQHMPKEQHGQYAEDNMSVLKQLAAALTEYGFLEAKAELEAYQKKQLEA